MNIETMTVDHLEDAQALTTSFNWPHTIEDWSFAFRLGSGLVAHAGGKLVGTCLTWQLGPYISTLGLLAVAGEAQGQGLGRILLKQAIEDQKGRTIFLHATHQAIDLYSSENFEAIGEARQLQGTVLPRSCASVPNVTPTVRSWEVPLTSAQMDHVLALDHEATGLDRRALLRVLLPLSKVWIIGSQDNPLGFACVRPFGRGHVVGPVVAPSAKDAHALISNMLETYIGRFVRIDVAGDFTPSNWLVERGLREIDRVQAMSNGPMPQGSGRVKRFALIGHAFG